MFPITAKLTPEKRPVDLLPPKAPASRYEKRTEGPPHSVTEVPVLPTWVILEEIKARKDLAEVRCPTPV